MRPSSPPPAASFHWCWDKASWRIPPRNAQQHLRSVRAWRQPPAQGPPAGFSCQMNKQVAFALLALFTATVQKTHKMTNLPICFVSASFWKSLEMFSRQLRSRKISSDSFISHMGQEDKFLRFLPHKWSNINSPEVSRPQSRGRLKDMQMWSRWMERRCRRDSPTRLAHQKLNSLVLTVSAVEFGEARCVAAGQLGGAPEGGRQQTGNQSGVARLCQPVTKQNRSTWLKMGLHLDCNKRLKAELLAFKFYVCRVSPTMIWLNVTIETSPDPSLNRKLVLASLLSKIL